MGRPDGLGLLLLQAQGQGRVCRVVRDVTGMVSLTDAVSGIPLAMASASQKKGEGEKCEMRVALNLIKEADLSNAIVSADALHCQQETVREILMSGGEALVQVKANQKSILSACEAIAAGRTPLFAQETAWHLCTQEAQVRDALQWGAVVRDHWGIESRNHNRRDSQLLEDKTRSRNPDIVGNLAVARAALLFFNAHTRDANVFSFAAVGYSRDRPQSQHSFSVSKIVNFVIDYFAPRIICANHQCWNVSGKPYGMLVNG